MLRCVSVWREDRSCQPSCHSSVMASEEKPPSNLPRVNFRDSLYLLPSISRTDLVCVCMCLCICVSVCLWLLSFVIVSLEAKALRIIYYFIILYLEL